MHLGFPRANVEVTINNYRNKNDYPCVSKL